MPSGLKAAGKDLWRKSLADNEFAAHELVLLESACRFRDTIKALDAEVAKKGVLIPSPQGERVNPVIAEARQQRMALARMLVTLDIPGLEDDQTSAQRARRIGGVGGGPHG